MSRWARRVDDNQAAIVKTLRKAGAFVQSLSSVGAGVPDLLVGWRGQWLLVEVKDGRKVRSARQLTPAQKAFHAALATQNLPVRVVESPEQALEALGWKETENTST